MRLPHWSCCVFGWPNFLLDIRLVLPEAEQVLRGACSEVEYLNSRDATIMGSRNGHAPIYMWYTLTLKGYDGMRKDVEKCLRNANLLKVPPPHPPPPSGQMQI